MSTPYWTSTVVAPPFAVTKPSASARVCSGRTPVEATCGAAAAMPTGAPSAGTSSSSANVCTAREPGVRLETNVASAPAVVPAALIASTR